MNLASIRTILRRQVQDPAATQFSDQELNDIINLAYSTVQLVVYQHDQEAHIVWETIPVTAGTNWYPMPDTFGLNQVRLKVNSTDTIWTVLTKKSLNDIETVLTTGPNYYYARRGQWIGIFPTPPTSISDGIQVLHAPIMQLTLDTDIPKIKSPLHIAILWLARLYAQDEDEAVDLTKVEARLNSLFNSIPSWYEVNSDAADRLAVDLGTFRSRAHDNSTIGFDN